MTWFESWEEVGLEIMLACKVSKNEDLWEEFSYFKPGALPSIAMIGWAWLGVTPVAASLFFFILIAILSPFWLWPLLLFLWWDISASASDEPPFRYMLSLAMSIVEMLDEPTLLVEMLPYWLLEVLAVFEDYNLVLSCTGVCVMSGCSKFLLLLPSN